MVARLQRAQPRGPDPRRPPGRARSRSPCSASTARSRPRRSNYIWMRTATLDFYAAERARSASRGGRRSSVDARPRRDRSPADARLERVAGGFEFTEGPVWAPRRRRCSSARRTRTRSTGWTPTGEVTVFRSKSGYTGVDIGRYHQPGSNGLTFSPDGPADDLPARQPPRHPRQPPRRHHRARRPLRGPAAEQPRTTSSTAPTARSTSPTRRSACRACSTTRQGARASAASSASATARSRS